MAKLQVEIVTGERVVFTESDIDMVIAPGSDGTLGILPHHAPLIATLAIGELRIKKGATEHSIAVFGGFIEVTPEKVVILADSAERAEEIDIARAEAARQRAVVAVANRGQAQDIYEDEMALRRASLRLQLGQRRRAPRSPGVASGADNAI